LWCAASSELAPQSSSNSNQYHLKVLNSYTIHEKQSKRTRKKQSWKWLVAKNVSHELVKRGNPYIWVDQRLHCCRSEQKSQPKGYPPPTWNNQWLHMKKLQPAMASSFPALHKATPHVLQVQEHVPAFDAFRKSVAPTCHVFGTTRWIKPAECAFRN
jgi:hypothetical protein